MVTYEAIWREGKSYGITEHQLQKINMMKWRTGVSLGSTKGNWGAKKGTLETAGNIALSEPRVRELCHF